MSEFTPGIWYSDLDPSWQMGVIVLVILVVASVALPILRRVRPRWQLDEVAARVKSWWVMAGVFFFAVVVDQMVSIVFFALLSFWALKEYVTLLDTRRADHRALVWLFLAVPIQYYWVATDWYGMFVLFIPLYLFLFLPLGLILAGETKGFVRSAATLHWGAVAFVFGLSHLAMLLRLPVEGAASGRTLLLFLVFIVELSDVLQFLWGKAVGRHLVIPTISPNKTWEGLVGGVLTASVIAVALRFLTPFSVGETFGVAVLVTLSGFVGGAVMSAVKRDFGVKDFGTLIPGHGGMLDRVDSLCWAAPIFFHWVRYFH